MDPVCVVLGVRGMFPRKRWSRSVPILESNSHFHRFGVNYYGYTYG